MAQLTDLPVAIRATVLTLFQAKNYCFATQTKAHSPTFYFALGGAGVLTTADLCGRICTQTDEGALIDVSRTAKGHYFFRSDWGRNRVAAKLDAGLGVPEVTALEVKQRTSPRAGDAHLEYVKVAGATRPYAQLHRSLGRVALQPRFDTDDQVVTLLDRVMAGRCRIMLGGQSVHESLSGTGAAGSADVAAFLADL